MPAGLVLLLENRNGFQVNQLDNHVLGRAREIEVQQTADQADIVGKGVNMKEYIAFLRGINVGGKNMIAMPLLKTAFEGAGFTNVSTYINSGNVLFSSEDTDIAALQQRCRQAIRDAFGLDIPVAVLSGEEYSTALSFAPEWWDNDSGSKHIAVFVIAPANASDLVREVGIKPEYEQAFAHGAVIFWSAPLKTFSRTKWSKVIATPAYSGITIRNANTTKKLLTLLNQA